MDHPRVDLAALIAPLWRQLVKAEKSAAGRHGLSMWAYGVLHRLNLGPIPSQKKLAAVLGVDKTRLVGFLDELQGQGFVERSPAPTDRRQHGVAITSSGVSKMEAIQGEIRSAEAELLQALSEEQTKLLRVLLTKVWSP